MNITARVRNSQHQHEATVASEGHANSLPIPPKANGYGSAVNGGELLFLALATCYCNDVYREAALQGITVHEVEVEAVGDFFGPGEPPENVRYHVRVKADATDREIRHLLIHTDTVAEVHNALRRGIEVRLGHIETETVYSGT
jgi:organic hydroperoxide reductase OsmC/OhrA